jgi:peptidoglycan lytic transglycosylase
VTRRAIAHPIAVFCACAAVLAVPALGHAASGGGGLSGSGPSPGSHSQQSASSGTMHAGNVPVSASGGGISIQTRSSAFLSNGLHFSGSAPSQDAGRTLVIERSGHETNWAWTPTVQTRINSNGTFSAVWETNHIGQFAIRAVLASGRNGAADATSSSDWPTVNVIVYRPSVASWYGGNGVWGSTTACGEVLHRNTLGVANRTLPCGTKVALYYQGRSITVPVIDRGPYVSGRDWDLTEAVAELLKMDGVAQIGAVSLPGR